MERKAQNNKHNSYHSKTRSWHWVKDPCSYSTLNYFIIPITIRQVSYILYAPKKFLFSNWCSCSWYFLRSSADTKEERHKYVCCHFEFGARLRQVGVLWGMWSSPLDYLERRRRMLPSTSFPVKRQIGRWRRRRWTFSNVVPSSSLVVSNARQGCYTSCIPNCSAGVVVIASRNRFVAQHGI